MKRMKPDEYKGEAHRRIGNLVRELVMHFGEWSARKVMEMMERELRDVRLGRNAEDKT